MRLIWGFLIIIVVLWLIKPNNNTLKTKDRQASKISDNDQKSPDRPHSISAFVPYWHIESLDNIQNPINNLQITKQYYFGVTITKDGDIDESDSGFINLMKIEPRDTILVVRIIDQNIVDSILENDKVGERASRQVAELAKELGFKGILIDLEYSALPTSKTKNNITKTISLFAKASQQRGLTTGATIYGDSYFRGRPYDVQKIGKVVDEIVVMAYDFHKSKSLPGPLFPFNEDDYGYSFKKLVADYVADVPPNKLTIAYGMYGYQWETDKKLRPIKRATALPIKDIHVATNNCNHDQCVKTIDPESSELKITKRVENGFVATYSETEKSIQTKIDFASQFGVYSSVLWVNGYW